MKIKISKQSKIIEEIDIELPYYYKHDIIADDYRCIIYGCIKENELISIGKDEYYLNNKISFSIDIEKHSSIKNSGLGCYFDKIYKSTQDEFEKVKNEMINFILKND